MSQPFQDPSHAQVRGGAGSAAGPAQVDPAVPVLVPAVDDAAPAEETMVVRAARATAEAVAYAAAAARSAALPEASGAAAVGPPPSPPIHTGHSSLDGGRPVPRGRSRRLRIGSHLASHSALAQLGPAGPAAGLVVGVDPDRRPVTVRLFRAEPTRVAVVGDPWTAQLLVFRAFAVGARVVVVSDHPQSWLSFGQHATGRSDRLLAVAPESIASGASARTPTLILDDRGDAATAYSSALGPWQTQVTLLHRLEPPAVRLVQECDLAILQRLGVDEARLAALILRLPSRSVAPLQAIPDDGLAVVAGGADRYVSIAQTDLERAHVGAPSPRAVPPPRLTPAAAPPPPSTPPPSTPPQRPAPPIPPAPPTPPAQPIPPPARPPAHAARPEWAGSTSPGIAVVRPGLQTRTGESDAGGTPPDVAPRRTGRRRRPVMIGAGAVLVLTLAGWAAGFLLTGTGPAPTPPDRPGATVTVTPQEVVHPMAVAVITANREGDGIRFSWTYDDPAPGDFFRVQRVGEPGYIDLTEPSWLVDAAYACVQVQIFRSNGQGGPAQVKCFPS